MGGRSSRPRGAPSPVRALLVSLQALSLCSCSLVLVKTLPEPPPRDRMAHCTASRAPALLDMAGGGALTAGMGFIALANLPEGGESTQIGLAWAAGALVTAGLFGYSAMHGFIESDRCEAYRLEMLYRGRDGAHGAGGALPAAEPSVTID